MFSSDQLAQFEKMYDPHNAHLGRSSGTDLQMFGYYVMNNVSIAFRTFASGLFFGVGAIYVLAANGVLIGGVAGHLTAIGYGHPFWRFVVGPFGVRTDRPGDRRWRRPAAGPDLAGAGSATARPGHGRGRLDRCAAGAGGVRDAGGGRVRRGVLVVDRQPARCGEIRQWRAAVAAGAGVAVARRQGESGWSLTGSAWCCARARRARRWTWARSCCGRMRAPCGRPGSRSPCRCSWSATLLGVLLGLPWLGLVLMWWLKPLFDRLPLYVLSRAVFDRAPGWRDTLRGQRRWGWRSTLAALTWLRIDSSRALRLPLDLLEGAPRRQRSARWKVLRRRIGRRHHHADLRLPAVRAGVVSQCLPAGLAADSARVAAGIVERISSAMTCAAPAPSGGCWRRPWPICR